MNISISHQLPQGEALARVKDLLNKLKEEQASRITNVKENWVDNKADFSFSAQGFNLAGQITVNPASVNMEAELPFALSFFQGKIKEMITGKLTELLRT